MRGYPLASIFSTPLFYGGLWRSRFLKLLKLLKRGSRRLSLTAAASPCSPIKKKTNSAQRGYFYHTPVPSSAGVEYVPQQESAEFLPAEGGASFERGVYPKWILSLIGALRRTAIAPSGGGYKHFLYRLGTFIPFSEKRRTEALEGLLARFWRTLGFTAADFTLYRRWYRLFIGFIGSGLGGNELVMGTAGGGLRVCACAREGDLSHFVTLSEACKAAICQVVLSFERAALMLALVSF